MLEDVVFVDPDPRVQAIKAEWAEAKRRKQVEYDRVMQRLGPAIEAGKAAEAEKILNEALKLLGERVE